MNGKILALAAAVSAAALGGVVYAAGAQSSSAVPSTQQRSQVAASQLLKRLDSRTVSGPVAPLGETVNVGLGLTPRPVVVIWNADVANTDRMLVQLRVNGGPCGGTPNPGQIKPFPGPGFELQTIQFIVFPSEGLVPGANTLELCAGAHPSTPSAGAIFGFRTLAVRKSN